LRGNTGHPHPGTPEFCGKTATTLMAPSPRDEDPFPLT
jgi:hypothetical protein